MNRTTPEETEYGALEPYFNGYGEPWEVWEGRVSKTVQRSEYVKWLLELAQWKVLVTLTFREDKSFESARRWFDKLVRELNRDLLGKHYTRFAGESYFSYVLAAEFQLRGVIHFHFLADRPLNFQLIHTLWNDWAGFAHTAIIINSEGAVWYVAKYIVKGTQLEINRSKWNAQPIVRPFWWDMLEQESMEDMDSPSIGKGDPGEAVA